ncbi:MAG TPA: carboxypeptidase regulatory-like domain-containing protein, partial [Myxococcales bacterium]|nr:carboxypeptidase regulatory-like domain-containing protein [Myxococcales bacterium]
KITICDGTGKRVLTFDVKAKKLLIEAKQGSVELKAQKKIRLLCEDLEVKASKDAKLDVSSTFALKVGSDLAMKAGGTFTLKGSQVQINPSSLSLAALAGAVAKAIAGAGAGAGGAAGAQAGAGGGGAGGAGGQGAGAGGAAAGGAGGSAAVPTQDVAPAGGAASAQPAQKPAEKPAEQPAAAAAESVGPGKLAVKVVNVAGDPQANLEFEITKPDGTMAAGKTDAKGAVNLDGLPDSGECTFDLPDVKPAAKADPSVAGRVRFVEGGVKVKIGAASTVEVPARVRRCRLSGLNFDTNKTFLLPQAMTGIRQLVKLYKSFEGIQGLIDGHTDKQPPKVGETFEFNRKLSVERAESIAAYLTDDAQAWQKFYAGTGASGKWGVREDQLMLATVKDSDGSVFYDGEIDGKVGQKTKDAYHKFQSSRLLDQSDTASSQMRLELVRAYMALDGTSLPPGANPKIHGCGLTHPLPETASDPDPNQPKNRRVEVYLFDGAVDPPPVDREPRGGCEEHAKWVGQMILDVDLDQAPGNLKVFVIREDRSPIAGARVHISGPLALDATTGADGVAVDSAGNPPFDELIPGGYKVIAEADGFFADDVAVTVRAGQNGEADVKLKAETFALDVLVEDDLQPPNKLQGATVTIDAPGATPQTTGDDGLAHFKNLPRGNFTVTASRSGFATKSAPAAVPASSAAPDSAAPSGGGTAAPAGAGKKPVTIPLKANVLHPGFVEVKDAFGAPIPGAQVEVIGLVKTQT